MAHSPTSDTAILARLSEFGPYLFHKPSLIWRWLGGFPSEIEWVAPAGFDNELAPFVVALWFPFGKAWADDDLRRLLHAMEDFRAQLPSHIAALRSYVLECFRECYEDQLDDYDRKRLVAPDGSIPDALILHDVESIHVRFDAMGKALVRTAWLAVRWDDEHGLDAEWDAAGKLTRPWRDIHQAPS